MIKKNKQINKILVKKKKTKKQKKQKKHVPGQHQH